MEQHEPKRKQVDRWRTFNYVYDHFGEMYPDLRPIDFAVFTVIFRHADKYGFAKISTERIRQTLNVSNWQTVQRSIDKMIAMKVLSATSKRRTHTEYYHVSIKRNDE